ncbi:MAG: hypothetical protein IIZ60_04365, partial [Clostridia bacterium]|nr:hypothetical protein [Clostridia bacterium]
MAEADATKILKAAKRVATARRSLRVRFCLLSVVVPNTLIIVTVPVSFLGIRLVVCNVGHAGFGINLITKKLQNITKFICSLAILYSLFVIIAKKIFQNLGV